MNRPRVTSAEILGILSTTGWLAEQPQDFQARIAHAGRWTRVSKGARLYYAGEEARAMFGLGDGLLDVSIPISPSEEVVVHRAPPGFWIGDGALLSGIPRTVSVEAAVDCRVFAVPIDAIRRILAAHPEDWMYLHRLSSRNSTLATRVLAETLALPPRARFARLLLRIATPDGSVRLTQEELGRMAGMSRAAFRRAFASLIDAGVVKTGYGGVQICDPAALEREANSV